ncbi:hypothetical protein D770_20410 [Flammeovirgaceae bacterium 311]|nr:hypothetical protein D770_20410 [Flammeovirgaceae bacterium 311]
MKSSFKNKALTKALVYWIEEMDGRSVSTFYSLDRPKAINDLNHQPGLAGLKKRVVDQYLGKYKRVIIYRNTPDNTGEELRRYNEKGKEV